MPKPPPSRLVIAVAAVIFLMSPSPAGVSTREPVQFNDRPAVPPPAASLDALGPWAVEQMLLPYSDLADVAAAPRFALPPAHASRWLPEPVASSLGPWRVEQLACPYAVTPPVEPEPVAAREPVAAPRPAPEPLPAPISEIDSPLGPWPVEQMLLPYPITVSPGELREYAKPLRPARPAPATRAAYGRALRRAAGSVRRFLYLVDDGARAVNQALRDLARPAVSTLGGPAVPPDSGAHADPAGPNDADERLSRLFETLDAFAPTREPGLTDDQGSFLLPWPDAPLTVSDPPALEGWWTDAAQGPVVAPVPLVATSGDSPPLRYAGLDRLFPPSTGVAFVAALLLIPMTCSVTAGAVRRHARDGPRRQ
jgi:hypothetical protein